MKEMNENEIKDASPISLKRQFSTKKGRTRFITRVAMFSALSFVFYAFIKFPLPFFPSFLEVKFHNLFLILSGLLTGLVGGIVSVVVMILLKLLILSSSTGFVGEFTDLIISLMVVLPSSLIYMKWHNKKDGIIGILISLLTWILTAILVNVFISVPFYINFYFGGSAEAFANMLSSTISNINEQNLLLYYLLYACLPFNAIVAFVNISLAIIVYKRISVILKSIGI